MELSRARPSASKKYAPPPGQSGLQVYPAPSQCEIHVGEQDWQSNPDNVSAFAKLVKRAIRTNDIEKAWLRGLNVRSSSHLILDAASRFALGEYENELFLIAVGVEVDEPPAELQPVALNAGMFTAIGQVQ